MTSEESPSGLGARRAAHELLAAVLRRHQSLDDALEQSAAMASLAPRDRALARLIVATCLRRLGQIDRVLNALLDHPLPPRATLTQDALRIGAAQLLFLDTPPHAAVGTAVALISGRHAVYRGLVNAVLRRVARDGSAMLATISTSENLPGWLRESWVAAYGEAGTAAIADALMADPPLDLTLKSGDPAAWATSLDARVLPTGTLRRTSGGAPSQLPGFTEGAWWVQDAAATLPVKLLGDLAGGVVIDLCAAPGGKTAQIAACGARVIAVERSVQRARRLGLNLERLGLTAEIVVADAAVWTPAVLAARVLLDAPCSATGTARRNPDVLHLKSADDVERLLATQARLLDAAAGMTARGGLLVYCVCSLQPEEGPAQIDAFLARDQRFLRVPIVGSEIGGLVECIDPKGDLRTLPSHLAQSGGLDGFYAARLLRTG